jgi:hypothetical protein
LDDLLDNLHIDVEIIVNNPIPEADNFAPFNLGMLGREFIR